MVAAPVRIKTLANAVGINDQLVSRYINISLALRRHSQRGVNPRAVGGDAVRGQRIGDCLVRRAVVGVGFRGRERLLIHRKLLGGGTGLLHAAEGLTLGGRNGGGFVRLGGQRSGGQGHCHGCGQHQRREALGDRLPFHLFSFLRGGKPGVACRRPPFR